VKKDITSWSFQEPKLFRRPLYPIGMIEVNLFFDFFLRVIFLRKTSKNLINISIYCRVKQLDEL